MIINGDGGYCLLSAYIGGPVAQAGRLGPKVASHLTPFLYSSREPSELTQWLCHDDSAINIVVVIIILIISWTPQRLCRLSRQSDWTIPPQYFQQLVPLLWLFHLAMCMNEIVIFYDGVSRIVLVFAQILQHNVYVHNYVDHIIMEYFCSSCYHQKIFTCNICILLSV